MNHLTELRHKANLTQKELSNKSGIFIRQIQKIESGECKIENIILKNAAALANALGVEIKDLLYRE